MALPKGNYELARSSSGTVDTQGTIISQYSHMQKDHNWGMSSMYPIDTAAQGGHREPKPGAEDNVQPRFELFLLADGEKKVIEEPDTRESPLYSKYVAQIARFEPETALSGSLGFALVYYH